MKRFQNAVLEGIAITVRNLAKVVYVKHVINDMGHPEILWMVEFN
jgi:hypothetical protein